MVDVAALNSASAVEIERCVREELDTIKPSSMIAAADTLLRVILHEDQSKSVKASSNSLPVANILQMYGQPEVAHIPTCDTTMIPSNSPGVSVSSYLRRTSKVMRRIPV